jgi:glycosyltransferase involved in cell wall biosynthesis
VYRIGRPFVITLVGALLFVCAARSRKKQKNVLIWGPTPIANNKYWSLAMRESGWSSKTLMSTHYRIQRREDFDLYFKDLVPRFVWPAALRDELAPYLATLYIIRNAAVVHISFLGGPLGSTPLWRLEARLLRLAGVRTAVIPFGGDVFLYSQILDPTARNGLLISYPDAGRNEHRVRERVQYWTRHADVIVTGFTIDSLGRWDVPAGNMLCIDTRQWRQKQSYSSHDGRNGPVRIMHTPNHRGVKGTEFLIEAVRSLREEGLEVELVLLENVPNENVRESMQEVDILADQFVLPGYGLNAVEGMATGLPVICNLENETYTRLFRRYSYLDECPLVSASAETIKETLEVLVTNPRLREELGQAGREYVEKYHSFAATQYLFGSIYDKILFGREVDLLNLFHPLKSAYNRRLPRVTHPLVENHLPSEYATRHRSPASRPVTVAGQA